MSIPSVSLCVPRLVATAIAVITLSACGGDSETASSPPAAPTPPPANIAPVAEAGPGQAVIEADPVTLSGSQSRDDDGSITDFAWIQTSGPALVLEDANSAQLSFTAPLVLTRQQAELTLTVTDDDGATSSDSVIITIDPAPRRTRLEVVTPFDGIDRAFTVYTPASYSPGAPAVMLLHGGSGSMRDVLRDNRATRLWLDLADQDGFLLIVPNGYNPGNDDGLGDDQQWNDIRRDQPNRSSEDDVGFLSAVRQQVLSGRDFDADRLFVTGSSNGGIMSMTLLIERSLDYFGAAAFIASLPEEAVPFPTSPTPIMMLNGTEDPLIRFEGGVVGVNGPPTRSVLDTVAYWATANLAGASPDEVNLFPDADPDDGCRITENIYRSTSNGGAVLVYYQADGGGHSIPQPDAPPRSPQFVAALGPQCRDVQGVELVYAFFRSLL
ncbi:MAG: hypothetical protein AAGH53_05970 [Pseudomonadota bacterium]